jgi:ankyrin repeat protein
MARSATRTVSSLGRLTPDIFHAAEFNDINELVAALREGQSLNARKASQLNMTPVHVACIHSSNEFLSYALQNVTCDPWIRDDNLRTAFDHASAKSNKKVMQLLFNLMYPVEPQSAQVLDFPAS